MSGILVERKNNKKIKKFIKSVKFLQQLTDNDIEKLYLWENYVYF